MDRVIYTDTPLKLTAYFRAQILCILCALEILIKDYKQCNRCMYCIKYVTLEVAVDKSGFRTLHSNVSEWLLSFDENWICKLVPVIERAVHQNGNRNHVNSGRIELNHKCVAGALKTSIYSLTPCPSSRHLF